ncbi:MAG: hypothetical protein PHN72_05925 [Bacilli bacterium]|nr:hypothetical protein [Bacilli bacterium]
MKKMIQNYITRITENDIASLASQNGIYLNQREVTVLYQMIKNDYEILLYGDSRPLWALLSQQLQKENYEKIYQFYLFYKNKYQSFL